MGMRYPVERRGDEHGHGPGEQPYEDAREDLAENEAAIRDSAIPGQEVEEDLSEEDRKALLEQNAEDRFAGIGDERREDQGTDGEG